MTKRLTFLLILFTFILALQSNLSLSSSKTISKDQIACTMCDSCENPCQPIPSPPPPPPPPEVICPPPPPPAVPECPPPPAPPSCSACIPSPDGQNLSPPKMPMPFPPQFPPYTGPFTPPDRVPYFPNYYNPPPSSATSISHKLRVTSVFVFLALLCCF